MNPLSITPDPDLGADGGKACVPSAAWGDVSVIHECRFHPGEYKTTSSDGPIRAYAPAHLFQTNNDVWVLLDERRLRVSIGDALIDVDADHVSVDLGDTHIVATEKMAAIRTGNALTESTPDHVRVTLGHAQVETTADRVDATVGSGTRISATADRIDQVAVAGEGGIGTVSRSMTIAIVLPAVQTLNAGQFVCLTAAGADVAEPGSSLVIGTCQTNTTEGADAPIQLISVPFIAKAAAKISRADSIEIAPDGRAQPWSAESGATARSIVALWTVLAGENVLLLAAR